MKAEFSPMGDEHILISLGNSISKSTLAKVIAFSDAVSPFVEECMTAYSTIMVRYSPLIYEYSAMVSILKDAMGNASAKVITAPAIHIVPVQYGGEFGQDLKRVALNNNITEKQVIKLHTKKVYTVHMIGFLPGFCYLGGLSKRLATPRLDVPRKKIVKGSVGIAGNQTGVYPIESPGGWNIIGRTEYEFFTQSDPPCQIKIGDSVRFIEV